MSEFKTVDSIAEFRTLDEADILLGYIDGFDGLPCPGNGSRAFVHGWRNGMADAGHAETDHAQIRLAAEFARAVPCTIH